MYDMNINTKMSTLWSVGVHSVGINNNGLVQILTVLVFATVCGFVKICGVCARISTKLKQLLHWFYDVNYSVLLIIIGIIPYNQLHE